MTHHWEALGWTLIHFCWQAAAMALVYKLADAALTKGRASTRYLLALVALLGMLAASLTTLAYEEAQYHHFTPLATGNLITIAPGLETMTHASITPEVPAAPKAATRLFSNDVMPYLDAFWFAGVLCLSFRTFGGWWLIRRLRHVALQKAPHTLRIHLDEMRIRMGIPQFVDLRISSRIASPLTVGFVRPLILLPVTALTGLSPEQLEVVLAHELAHIRRADYFWNILQTIVETLFFFHPAVWWISRQIREQRELCCDDVALEICNDPAVYASALLRLEEERRSNLHFAMALDGNQSRTSLRARIMRILDGREEQPQNPKPLSLAGMLAALILFVCPLPQVFASFKQAPKVSAEIVHAVQTAARPAIKILKPASKPVTAQIAMPEAAPAPVIIPTPGPPAIAAARLEDNAVEAEQDSRNGKADYIDKMRAAGYDVDLDKYVAMKVQGITPEYAADMAKATGRKPSADELIAMKVQGIHPDYIAQMRSAGYDADLNKYIAMKVQGISPDYVQEMTKATGRKPNVDELIAMKVQGINPDYIAQMRSAGYDTDLNKYIAMKVQGVTPDYANALAKAGFGKPSVDDLIAMKVQGVAPDYAQKLRDGGIEVANFHDLISYKIFNVSPEYVTGMKNAGFGSIPTKKLLDMRVQGVTPEKAKAIKAQFPDASSDDLIQMQIFHIDSDFIASAKRHGFTPLTIQKLVKLRISGILDDNENAKDSQ